MAKGQQNQARIFLDIWLARLGSVFAWVWLVFWGMIGIVGLGEILFGNAQDAMDWVMPLVCLGLAYLHYLLVKAARKTKELVADFRLYCAVFARTPDKSIPDLAAALNVSPDAAMSSLQEMCKRGYFNGYIDHVHKQMRFSCAPSSAANEQESQPVTVVYCPGCGARNAIARTGDTCRYCDAPLHMN